MYGTEPRKPGDHWTVDAKDTIFNEDANMTNTSGKVELTFDKVADYKGMKCAFLSGTIQISGTPTDLPADGEGKLKMTSKVVIVRALEQQMDLDAKMTGTMEMQRKLPDGRSMRIIGPLTLHSETKMF